MARVERDHGKVIVTLTPLEELRGARAGFARRERALRLGLTHRFKSRGGFSQWISDIEGACAELAVALVADLPWTSEEWDLRHRDKPDVGKSIEVRWSMSRDALLTFDPRRDHADRFYVLATGFAPRFVLHGYRLGSRCCREEWLHAYPERTVCRVPIDALDSFERSIARASTDHRTTATPDARR